MGLLDRVFRRGPVIEPANVEAGWEEAGEWRRSWGCPLNVVREGFHQEHLVAMCGPPRKQGYLIPVAATLIREPENQHDRNAVRVEVDGRLVGYVRRDMASSVGPWMDKAGLSSFVLCGLIRGGATRAKTIGIHVWTDRRLSPGPEMSLKGDVDTVRVSWPPRDGEGVA